MASGVLKFKNGNSEAEVGFDNVPDDVVEKVAMILIDHKSASIDSSGNLSTNFYPNRKINRAWPKDWLRLIKKCHYVVR